MKLDDQRTFPRRVVWIAAVSTLFAGHSSAQCPAWSPDFHARGVNGYVRGSVVFDDGTGPALYFLGGFDAIGNVQTDSIAKWNGQSFSALGAGLRGSSGGWAGAVFDDGSGDALYVVGAFHTAGTTPANNIARWDGASWSNLGLGLDSSGWAAVTHDDGNGPALYVSGLFSAAGGVAASGIARWNGAQWSALPGISGPIQALASFDDGGGPALYASGTLASAGFGRRIARWDGASWTDLGALGGYQTVRAFTVHDDGAGAALYVGGLFSSIGGLAATNLARWSSGSWSAVGAGSDDYVMTLVSHDDGSGAKLVAAGGFETIGGVSASRIAVWNGSTWSPYGAGIDIASALPQPWVYTLSSFDGGAGPRLIAGGAFGSAGGRASSGLAEWDGAWRSVPESGLGTNSYVRVMRELDLGAGSELYLGGDFTTAGDAVAARIAKRSGDSWVALGGGLDGPVSDLCVHDDGSGSALYVVGAFEHAGGSPAIQIARWDGSSWSQVGGGIGSGHFTEFVRAVASFDDGNGPTLFVGGSFDQNTSSQNATTLVRWNGATWQSMPAGEPDGLVRALVPFDDGSGEALYVGGDFEFAGATGTTGIARWNGTSWSSVGGGLSGDLDALAVIDLGSGPALYAAGTFTFAGTTPAKYVAKWDGSQWTAIGGSFNDQVLAVSACDDGTGPSLCAGGVFTLAGGTPVQRIAKWSGSNWSALGSGIHGQSNAAVYSLASFYDGLAPTPSLYVGGYFNSAGGACATNLARWHDACACDATSFCTSGTTSSGCVPTISGAGRASASNTTDFTLTVTGVEGAKTGHLFYGVNGAQAVPWGNSSHFLCVKAPTQRTGTQSTGGTSQHCDGTLTLDWDAYVATHPYSLGAPFNVGQKVWAQAFFRDPPSPKTTALSNGLVFTICP